MEQMMLDWVMILMTRRKLLIWVILIYTKFMKQNDIPSLGKCLWFQSPPKRIIPIAFISSIWSGLSTLSPRIWPLLSKNLTCWGFPDSSVIKNPAANAGDAVWSLIPEDPMCMEQPSPCATSTEPMLWSLGAATSEAAPSQGEAHAHWN